MICTDEVFALIEHGDFFGAIKLYVQQRQGVAADAALAASSWDEVQNKKGAYEELQKLKRLEAEYQTFTAKQEPAKK